MLFVSDVSMACINNAAMEYHLPAKLIVAVLNVERGKVGMAIKNANGTYDLGPMQINTSWWPRFTRMGISTSEVRNNACTNVHVGAWILSKNIADGNDLFNGIGRYHSHTLALNEHYTQQVRLRYTELAQWLA